MCIVLGGTIRVKWGTLVGIIAQTHGYLNSAIPSNNHLSIPTQSVSFKVDSVFETYYFRS